jgi:hypothetical protein
LLQGLILLGMRQIRQQGCNACILDYVSLLSLEHGRFDRMLTCLF